ncbi:hypothetical protein CAEBREN_20702 [Caenorhabditis brenneri]|uniref:Uncharacterized protein n=1 Tax=Caenorhabditis brenneri TaxID=135651 RepID=G0MM33_CAEBE|nr:hypothetical protein CAEBREN_20702 [Caenorhabditis brenneri]
MPTSTIPSTQSASFVQETLALLGDLDNFDYFKSTPTLKRSMRTAEDSAPPKKIAKHNIAEEMMARKKTAPTKFVPKSKTQIEKTVPEEPTIEEKKNAQASRRYWEETRMKAEYHNRRERLERESEATRLADIGRSDTWNAIKYAREQRKRDLATPREIKKPKRKQQPRRY